MKSHRLEGRRIEAQGDVERLGLLGDGVDDQTPDPERACGMDDPLGRILEECPADLPPLIGPIDRKTAEKRDGNGIRHVAPKPTRRRRHVDATGRQGVIAHDGVGVRRHIGARSAGFLIGERTSLEPIVEVSNAAIEWGKLVVGGQQCRSREGHEGFQGTAARMVRRSRSLGCAGASRRARNFA